MDKVIARKSHSAGMLYIVVTAIGIIMLVSGLSAGQVAIWPIGVLLCAVGGAYAVRYLLLPCNVIILSDDVLVLPRNTTFPLTDVTDVSYKKATARGLQYSWGAITVSTHLRSYRFNFICECEAVSKELTQLVFEAKNKK